MGKENGFVKTAHEGTPGLVTCDVHSVERVNSTTVASILALHEEIKSDYPDLTDSSMYVVHYEGDKAGIFGIRFVMTFDVMRASYTFVDSLAPIL